MEVGSRASRSNRRSVGFQMVAGERSVAGRAVRSGRLIESRTGVAEKRRMGFTGSEDEEDESEDLWSRSQEWIGLVGWVRLGVDRQSPKKSYRGECRSQRNVHVCIGSSRRQLIDRTLKQRWNEAKTDRRSHQGFER